MKSALQTCLNRPLLIFYLLAGIPLFAQERRATVPAEKEPMSSFQAAPVVAQATPGPFDRLVLVSWLKDDGKYVVFVQNTETNDTQKITPEPNKNNLRIVEIHLNDNPKLVQAVISNGKEQGAVKFRVEVPPIANPPGAVQLAIGAPGQGSPGGATQNALNP